MKQAIHTLLESYTTDFEIKHQLHDVPPHFVYEIEFEGRRAVCKVSRGPRGCAAIEGRVLRYVSEETSIPVPEVLTVGKEGFVVTYEENAPTVPDEGDGRLTKEWLRAAGRALGRLHKESTFDRPGLLVVDGDPQNPDAGLRVDATSQATWSDALDDLFSVYQESVRETGYAEVVAEARTFLASYSDRFDIVADNDPALLHGWFTPEHVAVADEEATCVIDFEHALVGSGEWDYWRTAVPLFLGDGWEQPPDAEDHFRAGYESIRSFSDGFKERAAAYRAFVTVSYLDSLQTQRGIDEKTREQADFLREHISDTLESLRKTWG